MAVDYVASSHASFVDGAEVVIGLPAGTAAGDVVIAAVSTHVDTLTVSWADGWVLRFSSTAGGSQVWLRTVTDADVTRGTYTVTIGGDAGVLVLTAYRGGTATWAAGTTSSLTAPSVGGASGTAVRVWLFGRTGTSPTTANPSGVTERARYGDSNAGIVVADAASSSQTGSKTATKSGTGAFTHDSGVTVLIGANRPPNAPTWISPPNGAVLNRGQTNRFAWAFSDPDPTDTQSAFDVRWKPTDSIWSLPDHHVTPSNYLDVTHVFDTGPGLQAQVRTYDRLGEVSQWSASVFFDAEDPIDAPTVTYPTDGGTVAAVDELDWSYPTQDAYQVRRVADAEDGTPDTGTVYFDTGEVDDPDARAQALTFEVNNRYEHLQLRVGNGGVWSDWVDVRVLVSYTPPPAPVLLLAGDTTAAVITLTIATPDPGEGVPAATSLLVQASPDGGQSIEWSRRLVDAVSGVVVFSTPNAGVDYWFCAVATADNGAAASSGWVL